MPKQSRVKKPKLAPIDFLKYFDEIFQRLCKLETKAVDFEDHIDAEHTSALGRIRSLELLGDSLVKQGESQNKQLNALDERQLVYVDAQIQQQRAYIDTEIKQLNTRMGSDFYDQDDEIEQISRRLQSVEDKLKAKQLGEETNVTLTARVKELQRQLTDAKNQIDKLTMNGTNQPSARVEAQRELIAELEARLKASNEARDCALEARDTIKAVYDEFRVMYAEMESKLAERTAAKLAPDRLFRRLFRK